jgi:transcriptional regulator NrdR family protein
MLLRFLSCHKLRTALQIAYFRSEFTANLVGRFIHEVGAEVNEKSSINAPSQAIGECVRRSGNVYKSIMSPRLKSVERRGKWIVDRIFEELIDDILAPLPLPASLQMEQAGAAEPRPGADGRYRL